ncbi:MAG: helix-turn-helix transcriptional regulator [Actinomycetota bacterium]
MSQPSLNPRTRTRSALAVQRSLAGLTQAAAAKEARVTVGHLSRVENGHVPLTLGLARRLSQIFQCPIRSLVRDGLGPRATGAEGNRAGGGPLSVVGAAEECRQ